MSYTPTNWQTGDTVTAEKLNKMEQGIYDIPYDAVVINLTYDASAHKWFTEDAPEVLENVKVYLTCDSFTFEAHLLKIFSSSFLMISTNFDLDNLDELPLPITYQLRPSAGGVYYLETVNNLNPFYIELTPTAQDYSGTMDKTPEEIDAAYRAGRQIRLRILGMDADVDATQYGANTNDPEYYQAVANVIYNGMLVQIITSRLDQTYNTVIYPLTP